MKTLAEVKANIDQFAAKICATSNILPTYGHTEDGARPHIEVNPQGYHYVVIERGEELKRISTENLDELLFNVFESVTFNIAFDYELAHRIENQDHRRVGFQHQIKLLSILSPNWAERELKHHEEIHRQHPFDDDASIRAHLSTQVGWMKACEKYPLPTQSD